MRTLIQFFFFSFIFWFLTSSCEKLTLDGYSQEVDEFHKTHSPLSIIENGEAHYSIVFNSDSTNSKGLDDFFRSYSSIRILGNESDSVIVVLGVSDHEESLKAFMEIDGFGFSVSVKDNHLVIVGSDETWTALALYALESALLPDGVSSKDSILVIPKNLHIKRKSRDPQLLAQLIREGYRFSLQSEFIMSCPGQGACTIPQGATCDGKFFYFIFRNGEDTQSIVYKYDINTLKEVKHSALLNTGHSNDMTFNPDTESLIVAHGMSQGNILTTIDTKSLSVVERRQINVGAGAITYNSKRKQYALSQGGTTLHIADKNFSILQSYSRNRMNGYTAQGMGSDDAFVYFPMSGSRKNILLAYDWEGNLVSTMDMGLSLESESMFYANCDYYVCLKFNGSALYRIKPILSYHFSGRDN